MRKMEKKKKKNKKKTRSMHMVVFAGMLSMLTVFLPLGRYTMRCVFCVPFCVVRGVRAWVRVEIHSAVVQQSVDRSSTTCDIGLFNAYNKILTVCHELFA